MKVSELCTVLVLLSMRLDVKGLGISVNLKFFKGGGSPVHVTLGGPEGWLRMRSPNEVLSILVI